MPIVYGRIAVQKLKNDVNGENEDIKSAVECFECHSSIAENDLMKCVNPDCQTSGHVICFSRYFLSDDSHILPVEGKCPSCGIELLWGDLVRKKKGCYKNLVDNSSHELDFLHFDADL